MKVEVVQRGRFDLGMFPNLRLLNRILESRERFSGVGLRVCASCNSWQPYIDKEMAPWQKPEALKYIVDQYFKGVEPKASHGICPACYELQLKELDEF